MELPRTLEKAPMVDGGRKFADMTWTQKVIFLSKLALCIVTFGFAFPNVQHD